MPTCYNQRQSLDLTYDNGDDVTLLTSHRSKFQRNFTINRKMGKGRWRSIRPSTIIASELPFLNRFYI